MSLFLGFLFCCIFLYFCLNSIQNYIVLITLALYYSPILPTPFFFLNIFWLLEVFCVSIKMLLNKKLSLLFETLADIKVTVFFLLQ